MFKLQSRAQLRQYILEELGSCVHNIEISEKQLDNCINKAISFYIERHDDGIEEVLFIVEVDDLLREDAYVELDDSIVGVQSIMDASDTGHSTEQFENLNHLVAKSDIFSGKSLNISGMVNYVRNHQTINNIRYFFTPFYDFEYNKITNRLHFRNDLSNITSLGVVVYRAIDPDVDLDIFNDEWIKRYSVALAHRQWGVNISKYLNVVLPGGIQLNGDAVLAEGKELVEAALEEFEMTYGIPPLPRVE